MRPLGGNKPAGAADGVRWWTFFYCPRCAGAVVIETNAPDEAPAEVLLQIPEGRGKPRIEHLPDDVEDYFQQAARALEAGLPDAAAVAVRRTLEAAASHFDHNERTLVTRIRGLIDDGLVTKKFGDVLHHVRQVGNLGAHATDKPVSDQAALQVYRFTEQVLRNLFEIPASLDALADDGDGDDGDAGPDGDPDS